jgi:ArsR family metal-binding transcriptional regulator
MSNTISNNEQAREALKQIREHQAQAKKGFSVISKAAHAEKAVVLAVEIIEYLLNKECQ